jgi:hypothetical protein
MIKIDLFEWLNNPFLQDKAPPGQIQLDCFKKLNGVCFEYFQLLNCLII